MPLFINTNVSSLHAQRAAQRANDALDVSYERLASGLRINTAKDDAAGLQVSNNLTTQLSGLTQGNRNAQDAIAYAQTAEGALDEVTNMLQRIRTLAIQAANGTISDQERKALQKEVDAMTDEICRISEETTFAGADILNGSADMVSFQLGPDPSSIIKIDLRGSFDISGLVAQLEEEGITNCSDITKPKRDPDTGEVEKDENGNVIYETISEGKPLKDVFSNPKGDSPGISIQTQESAQDVLSGIDQLINIVDQRRSDLGSIQNRVESTIRNQENVKENVSNSRATIRDTDFAEETAKLTSQQIIQQATATVLTQANQRPQIALSLLRQ